jgi:hypothetical protein
MNSNLVEFLRYCVAREAEKLEADKLASALNAMGVPMDRIQSHCDAFFGQNKAKQRVVLSLDSVDAYWVATAMAAMERRGGVRESASGLNGRTITQICMEWHGVMMREGKL